MSLIQMMCASKIRLTDGERSGCTSTSPRVMSSSSSSASVTASPSPALAGFPSNVMISRTLLMRREGTDMIGSPTATLPAAIVPA